MNTIHVYNVLSLAPTPGSVLSHGKLDLEGAVVVELRFERGPGVLHVVPLAVQRGHHTERDVGDSVGVLLRPALDFDRGLQDALVLRRFSIYSL